MSKKYIMKRDIRTFHVRLFTDIVICLLGVINVAFEGVIGAMATILIMNTVFITREVSNIMDFKEYWEREDTETEDTRGGEDA